MQNVRRWTTEHARLSRCLTMIAGALLMLWPAALNRYPLLFADSESYVENGRRVARAVFLHQFRAYYGMRSFLYSLGILPFHGYWSPWPVILWQAVLIAFLLWVTVRSVLPGKTTQNYLILIAVLSAGTSLSWFASLLMPDILGPALYLAVFLLLFARGTLSRAERRAVIAVGVWAVGSHATHMLIGGLLLGALAAIMLLRRSFWPRRRGWLDVAVIFAIAVVLQCSLHWYLYGRPSLNGVRPPFLMARLMGDGPARLYLARHCPGIRWAICADVNRLPDNDDDFLWADGGVFQSASRDRQAAFRREEVPLALGTLREYPRQQLAASAGNAWQQLIGFDYNSLGPADDLRQGLDHVFPGGRAKYMRSLQQRERLPFRTFAVIQDVLVAASVLILGAAVGLGWMRTRPRLAWLTVIVVFVVPVNAVVTGVLSEVDARYQSRVIWLLPFAAILWVVLLWPELRRGIRPVRPSTAEQRGAT